MGEFERRLRKHINTLVESWKDKIHSRDYIDAYRCIEHNLLEEDVLGLNEAAKECVFPEMPFIPPFVIEESNLRKGKELSEWLRKVEQARLNIVKWFGSVREEEEWKPDPFMCGRPPKEEST